MAVTLWDVAFGVGAVGVVGFAADLYTGLPLVRAALRGAARALRGRAPAERQVLVSDGPVTEPMPPPVASPLLRRRIPKTWGQGTYDDPVRPVYDARRDTFYGIDRLALVAWPPPRELTATPEGAARWRLAREAMLQHEEDGRMDVLLARGRQALKS